MAKRISLEVLYRGLRSSLPTAAREIVTLRNPRGRKLRADYFQDGRWVGWRTFHDNGMPELESALRDGERHGWEFRWDQPGQLLNAEPFAHDLPHGIAPQWDHSGRQVGRYTMIHGTGIDLWWRDYDSALPHLAESIELRDGCRHGYERWYAERRDALQMERHWWYGVLHGVEREWTGGRMQRGFPRFHRHGKRVSRASYLSLSRDDRTLPGYRPAEDAPRRPGACGRALAKERRTATAWNRLGADKIRPLPPIVGGILIGGASSRMGTPKHLLRIDGHPLVERLYRILRPFCERVVLLGRGTLPRTLAKAPRIPDTPGIRGPLAGITAAFRARPNRAWLIVGCDMPYVDTEALDWLIGQRRQGRTAVIPRTESGRPEPLLAIYEPAAREYLEWLAQQNRGPAEMAQRLTVHRPIVEGWFARAWRSVNTPAEFEECAADPSSKAKNL